MSSSVTISGRSLTAASPIHKLVAEEVLPKGQKKRDDRDAELAKWLIVFDPKDEHHLPSNDVLDISKLPTSLLTEAERVIVLSDATAIVEGYKARKHTVKDVLTAYCKVAIVAQQLTNCLTEIFFEEGFKRAEELDKYLAEQPKGTVIGPLHGVPVSIKDHIKVKGQYASTGYVSWATNQEPSDKDAVVVDILRKAGAIIYVKTANPQTLLSLETHNWIYGRTRNPFNRNLSPGGSSGGEGALISLHGSPLGVGTDIGGSIVIPAAWCGLYGFKASVARMPHAGLLGSHDGMDNIVGVVGPLATSARDIELFCRTMLQYEAWLLEHPVLEIPWKTDLAHGKGLPPKLCFAILKDDGVVKPHPPILEALENTKKAILAAGHEVIDWEPIDHQYAWDLLHKLYFLDGGAEYYQTFHDGDEKPTPSAEWILSLRERKDSYKVPETWELNLERERFRAKLLAHWNETKNRTQTGRPVDGILSPIHPTLAVPHDTVRWWGYSSYWNLADYPGVVFPTGRFDANKPIAFERTPPRNTVEEFVSAQWVPETYNGAPIALQLVGRRLNEEKVLGMLSIVEEAVKKFQV